MNSSPPRAEPTDVAALLREALALSERTLARPITVEDLDALVEARAPLLAAALAGSHGGRPPGPVEADLARRLQDLDGRLVAAVWAAHADAFAWLRERDPKLRGEYPSLDELATAPKEAESGEAAGVDPRKVGRYHDLDDVR